MVSRAQQERSGDDWRGFFAEVALVEATERMQTGLGSSELWTGGNVKKATAVATRCGCR
jgi:hypothetical protein